VTYCHTCERYFDPLGIASHRAAHRRRNETCRITYTNGDTYIHEFGTDDDEEKDAGATAD